jgi:hypothetical protein
MVFAQGTPLRNWLDFHLPALSFWPGHNPAQARKCPALGKRLMSLPISARITVAECWLTPGIVQSKAVRDRKVA